MISFFNATGGLQNLLDNFGIGDTWELAEGKLVFPTIDGQIGNKDTTITFLDISILSGLDLSLFPTLDLATNAILNYLNKITTDDLGSTNTLQSNIIQKNNILTYQLPNGQELVRSYGNKATEITLKIVLNESSYLNKLQKLYQMSSQNTGFVGITLYHPTLGIFNNCQIKAINSSENGNMFKGSIVDIELVTSSVFNPTTVTPTSTANTILGYIQKAIGIIQTLPTLIDTGEQIGVALSPLLNLAGDSSVAKTTSFSGSSIIVGFDKVSYSNSDIGNEIEGGAKFTNDKNIEISSAISQLTDEGIPIDYDLNTNVNIILEKLTQLNNVSAGGFGTNSISKSTSYEEQDSDISNLIYSETHENSDGTITTITRSVTSYTNGVYNIEVTTSILYPIENPNLSTIKSSINEMISYLSVLSNLIPTSYGDCASLISTLEDFYIFTQTSNDVITLDRNMTLIELAILYNTSTLRLLQYNDDLIGHNLLQKGMSIYLPPKNGEEDTL